MITKYYKLTDENKDKVINGVLVNKTLLLKQAHDYEDKTEFRNFKIYVNLADKKGLKRNFQLNQPYVDNHQKISFDDYLNNVKNPSFMEDIVFKILDYSVRTVCFSTRTDNDYLWNNYAGGENGFCVVYKDELRKKFKEIFNKVGVGNLFKKVKYTDKKIVYNLSSLVFISRFALNVPFIKKPSNVNNNDDFYKEEELRLAIINNNPETGEEVFTNNVIELTKIIDKPIKYVIANKNGKYFNDIKACCERKGIELKVK